MSVYEYSQTIKMGWENKKLEWEILINMKPVSEMEIAFFSQ